MKGFRFSPGISKLGIAVRGFRSSANGPFGKDRARGCWSVVTMRDKLCHSMIRVEQIQTPRGWKVHDKLPSPVRADDPVFARSSCSRLATKSPVSRHILFHTFFFPLSFPFFSFPSIFFFLFISLSFFPSLSFLSFFPSFSFSLFDFFLEPHQPTLIYFEFPSLYLSLFLVGCHHAFVFAPSNAWHGPAAARCWDHSTIILVICTRKWWWFSTSTSSSRSWSKQ